MPVDLDRDDSFGALAVAVGGDGLQHDLDASPAGSGGGVMANRPELSATARRVHLVVAQQARWWRRARTGPAITLSPFGSTRTMSKDGASRLRRWRRRRSGIAGGLRASAAAGGGWFGRAQAPHARRGRGAARRGGCRLRRCRRRIIWCLSTEQSIPVEHAEQHHHDGNCSRPNDDDIPRDGSFDCHDAFSRTGTFVHLNRLSFKRLRP